MKRICAWCGKKMGEIAPLDDPGITHGICRWCNFKEKMRLYTPYPILRFLKKQKECVSVWVICLAWISGFVVGFLVWGM